MPDGFAYPEFATHTPQTSTTPSLATVLAMMEQMLPHTPYAFVVMANAVGTIDGSTIEGPYSSSLYDLELALNKRALTLPVAAVEDAAAMLSIVARALERIEDFDLSREALDQEAAAMRAALENVLPFLADGASIHLSEIGCGTFAMADRKRFAKPGALIRQTGVTA